MTVLRGKDRREERRKGVERSEGGERKGKEMTGRKGKERRERK